MEEKLEQNETIIGKNLEILDVAKTIAKEKGLTGYTRLRKAQLIELLEQN